MGRWYDDDDEDDEAYDDEHECDEDDALARRMYASGWNYYSADRPRKVRGGLTLKSDQGPIGQTWWSKRWVEVLEAMGMGKRLTRGRFYAQQGQVISMTIDPGLVKAEVQGSMRKPYEVKIQLQPLSDEDWEEVGEAMASQAIFAAKLLAGEMPTTIEEAFRAAGLSLFPATKRDLQTSCSCPDWANPCKHIAAVYYILADRFDEDPFLLFKLRGQSKEEMIAALREKRLEALSTGKSAATEDEQKQRKVEEVPLRLEDHVETFWQAGSTLDTFAVYLQQPQVEKAILRRLGNAPYSIDEENIATLLAKAYDRATSEAAKYRDSWRKDGANAALQ